MKEYKKCYFAFIDFLGFKEIVHTKTCSEIFDIFNEAKRQYIINQINDDNSEIPLVPVEEIHYYIMSDSICIYIRDDIEGALSILTFLCMNFQVRMLCMDTPILVRGSIAKGDLFAEGNIIFGPVMIEAYLRAEKLAQVPRIIVPENLYNEMKFQKDDKLIDAFVNIEQDGFYATRYINYFCMHKSTVSYRENVKRHIMQVLNTSMEQSVREKYIYVKTWMDYYFNQENV